jgi:hypothetical protein
VKLPIFKFHEHLLKDSRVVIFELTDTVKLTGEFFPILFANAPKGNKMAFYQIGFLCSHHEFFLQGIKQSLVIYTVIAFFIFYIVYFSRKNTFRLYRCCGKFFILTYTYAM